MRDLLAARRREEDNKEEILDPIQEAGMLPAGDVWLVAPIAREFGR